MTDPRIEAAIEAAWKYSEPYADGVTFQSYCEVAPSVANIFRQSIIAALAAADQAAWRPIESAPKEETIIACGGNLYGPAVVTWSGLSGNPHWDYSIENHPDEIESPTHWQPLPSPPVMDVGGDDE